MPGKFTRCELQASEQENFPFKGMSLLVKSGLHLGDIFLFIVNSVSLKVDGKFLCFEVERANKFLHSGYSRRSKISLCTAFLDPC